jgi:hypothetical protein
MSRLDTQSDRLVRGPGSFEQQKSFLVQPQQFAAGNGNNVSQIVAGIAKVAGQVTGIQEDNKRKSDEKAAKLREARFNETFSELSRLEDIYRSEPTKANASALSLARSSAIQTFGTDTDEGVRLERSFLSKPELQAIERDNEKKVLDGLQGGYQRIINNLADEFRTPEMVDMLANMPFAAARAYVEDNLYNTLPDEVKQNLTDSTLGLINSQARTLAGGDAEKLRNERQAIADKNLEDSAYKNLLVSISQQPENVDQNIVEHAETYDIPFQELVGKIVDSAISALDIQVFNGDPEGITTAIQTLQSLPVEDVQVQEQISKAYSRVGSLEATRDAARFVQLGDAVLTDLYSKDEARVAMDDLGVEVYNAKFGQTQTVDKIEEIVPQNELEAAYLKELINGRDVVVADYANTKDKLTSYRSTLNNLSNASDSDVRTVANLAGAERSALLEEEIDKINSAGPQTPEAWNSLLLLDKAKTDNAAWAEVLGSKARGTEKYGMMFETVVKGNLDGPITQDGLRQAIAFAGNDINNVVHLYMGDYKKINALASTMRDAEVDPTIDIVSTYNGHVRDWESIRFKAKAGSGDTVGLNFGEYLQSSNFLKELTGEDRSSLSAATASTISALVGIEEIQTSSGSPKQVSAKIKEAMEKSRYYLLQRKTTGSTVVSVVSHRSIPEAVGFDSAKMSEDLLTDSRASRYYGTKLDPEGGQFMTGVIKDTIIENADIIPEGLVNLVSNEAIKSNIDAGKVRLFIDSSSASDFSTPVYVILDNQDGRSPVSLLLGNINFNDEVLSRSDPDFFKPINTQTTTTGTQGIRSSRPTYLFSFN